MAGRIQAKSPAAGIDWSVPGNKKTLESATAMNILPGKEQDVYGRLKSDINQAILRNAVKDIKPGPMTKLPPQGFIKTNAAPFINAVTQTLYKAPGRILAHLQQEQAKSASLPVGGINGAAVRDLVERPAQMLKAVTVDLPRIIAGGMSETGKTILEFADTYARRAVGQDLGQASLAAQRDIRGDEGQQQMERTLFTFNPKSYADYAESIKKVLDKSKDATDAEKRWLPLLLPVGMLGADLTPGSPGRKAIVKAVVDAKDAVEGAVIARTIGIHEADVLDIGKIFSEIKNDADAERYLGILERNNKIFQAAQAADKPALGRMGSVEPLKPGYLGRVAAPAPASSPQDKNSIRVTELSEKGDALGEREVRFLTGRTGKQSVEVYEDGNLMDIIDLPAAQKKYQTTDNTTLANRIVNGRYESGKDAWRLITPTKGKGEMPTVAPATAPRRARPKTPEEAVDTYYREVLEPAEREGRALVVGADDLKYYFDNDFDLANHPVYSKAANDLVLQAAERNKNPVVRFVAGGTGSGKSEVITKGLSRDFDGVIYDSTLANYEGARKLIDALKAKGKRVEIYPVIRDVKTAKLFTLIRESKGGHPVTDAAFARTHARVPEVLRQLLQDGDVDVKILDYRGKTTLADYDNLQYAKNPLAVLDELRYTEDEIRELTKDVTHANKLDTKPGTPNAGNENGGVPAGGRAGADNGRKNIDAGGGDGALRGQEGGGEITRPERKASTRVNIKLEKMALEAPSFDAFVRRAGVGRESLEATAKKKGFDSAADFYDKYKAPLSETDSHRVIGGEGEEWDYALKSSIYEGEETASNLEHIFASLKGIDVSDLDFKFTPKDLEEAVLNYGFARDALLDDPARGLTKYVSKTTGRLPEVTGTDTIKSLTGNGKDVPNSVFGRRGDDIVTEMGFESPEAAQDALEKYLAYRQQVEDVLQHLRAVRKDIQLQRQFGTFEDAAKRAVARDLAKDARALRNLVQAAERAGYRKGIATGSQRYKELVERLKSRRTQLVAVKKRYNLTDAQMREIRGARDPRWMNKEDFADYLKDVNEKAELQHAKNTERIIITAIIQGNDLKKAENLQKALEFPPLNQMTLEQLRQYGDILSKTEPGETFLGPRMIQTAKNTDLGEIRTMEDGIKAILKQTGMTHADPVVGSKTDRWLRDPTLAERDPLHKVFIEEFAAREAQMLTNKGHLQQEINRLAAAARGSRSGKGIMGRVFKWAAPQDDLIVKWLQPFEATYETVDGQLRKTITRRQELRDIAERQMTPQELEYARFLEKFFSHYYNLAQQEALQRWTLLGIKRSNYKNIYFAHMNRAFFERWKDDGLIKAMSMLWKRDVAHAKIDFNAFGDRGEVLGYEKWLNRSMVREGEGENKLTGEYFYTRNTAKVAMAYFHSFERKLILDSMTPKIKLLEFLMGKRFVGPKSINSPEGTEQVHSQLRKHINEWINNKKGQRIEMLYEQGDRAENVVDAARLFITIQQLGANIIAQTISGVGGEAINMFGSTVKGYALGHTRALTSQGRKLAHMHSGIIGEAPWRELGNAANDAGDTLRGGVFYIFGDMAYRARRQMFLGLLTPEELKTGTLTLKRQGEIKLTIGRWHAMPEFRSIAGSTSAVKAGGMYTEWAMPVLQNTYFVLLPRLRDQLRFTPKSEWGKLAKSEEFQTLAKMVIGGAGLAATAYLLLHPDQDDRSNLGYMRRKAAQEIGSIIQSITLVGIPTPGAVFIGYVDKLRKALTMLATMEEYETAGPGHKAGDLKGPGAVADALTPRGIQQWIPEPETPLRTEKEIALEIKKALDDGTMTVAAAKEKLKKDIAGLRKQQQARRFELEPKQYALDIKELITNKKMTVAEAKKDLAAYVKQRKERQPESFEAGSDAGFIDKVKVYAEAIGTDPITAFERIFTGQIIRRTDNGAIIVERMSYEASQKVRKERGANEELILDHTLPLQLGGDNGEDNLKLVPKADWERFTPVENYLGELLREDDLDAKKARQLILDFKAGKLTVEEVYEQAH